MCLRPQPVGMEASLSPYLLTQKVGKFFTRLQHLHQQNTQKLVSGDQPTSQAMEILQVCTAVVLPQSLCKSFNGEEFRGIWLKQPGLWPRAGPAEGRVHLCAPDDGNIEIMDCVSVSSSLHTS